MFSDAHSSTPLHHLLPIMLFTLATVAPAHGQERSGWEFYRQASAYANPGVEAPNAEAAAAEFSHYLWGAAHILQRDGSVCLAQDVSPAALWMPIYATLRDNESLRAQSRSELVAQLLPALYPCASAEQK